MNTSQRAINSNNPSLKGTTLNFWSSYAPKLKRSQASRLSSHSISASLMNSTHKPRQYSNVALEVPPNSMNSYSSKSKEYQKMFLSHHPSTISQLPKDSQLAILHLQQMVAQIMESDLRQAIKSKIRKSYSRCYQREESSSAIWVSQQKSIPREVLVAYHAMGESACLSKGFITQIGFMFYAVNGMVYFYDIETINQHSECHEAVQLGQDSSNHLCNIQVLPRDSGHLKKDKQLLAFLHPNYVQLYDCLVEQNEGYHQRRLKLNHLNVIFPVNNDNPQKLVMDKKGQLYYADNIGNLQFVDYDSSVLNSTTNKVANAISKTTAAGREFMTHRKLNIAKNIAIFAKVVSNSVVDFGMSFFAKNALTTLIEYDSNHDLIFIFKRSLSIGKALQQQIRLYSSDHLDPLHIIKGKQLIDQHFDKDLVVNMKCIDSRLNSQFNLVLLLSSGRRVYLHLNHQGLEKSVTYEALPYQGQFYRSGHQIRSSILEETYFASLSSPPSSRDKISFKILRSQVKQRNEFTNVDRDLEKRQKIFKVDVRLEYPKQQFQMYSRKLQQIDMFKHRILECQDKIIRSADMSPNVQGTFYQPQEIFLVSDYTAQRIVMLRPVDVLFTLIHEFQSAELEKAVERVLGSMEIEALIGLCCQIRLDAEGVYYISRELVNDIQKNVLGRRIDYSRNSQKEFSKVAFKQQPREFQSNIETLIYKLCQVSSPSMGERQEKAATGILKYLSKLLRPMWFVSVSRLSKDACQVMMDILTRAQEMVNLVMKRMFRLQGDSTFGSLKVWIAKLYQLLIVVMLITELPELTLSEVMKANPQILHQYIFRDMLKYFNQKQPHQLKNVIPFYLNQSLMNAFNLWERLNTLKTKQQQIQECKRHDHLPQYLVEHLSTNKKLKEVKIMFNQNSLFNQEANQYLNDVTSYQEILKDIQEGQSTLIQKQILVRRAHQKLSLQAKHNQSMLSEGQAEIAQLSALITLQILLKGHYLQTKQSTQSWINNLSQKLFSRGEEQLQKVKGGSLLESLDVFLLDFESLSNLIEASEDPLLDIAFVHYFKPDQVVDKINSMIATTLQSIQLKNINIVLKPQINFLMTKLRLNIQTVVLAKICMEQISQMANLAMIMDSQDVVLKREVFFVLCYVADLSGEPLKLHQWVCRMLKSSVQSSPFLCYLSGCGVYLVREYLPERKESLSNCITDLNCRNQVFWKKLQSLLQETL